MSPAEGVRLIVRSLVACGFVSVWWWGVVANSAPFAARFAAQSRPVVGNADWGGVVFVGLTLVWVGICILLAQKRGGSSRQLSGGVLIGGM